ncbi:hypothetical protein O181_020649 [Austropuccinia psidii MF-1]|uniref:Homoserine dehydrogenase n=1 Tax=Austropuccinia psidii MF-1 TaxID=1389203 RepID=A0A9Q3CBN8_9BASI|nr:hypothetical protein [Austropuccinia psidii MF-1]
MSTKLPINVAIVGVGLVGERVVHQLMLPQLRSVFRIKSLHTSRRHLELPDDYSAASASDLICCLKGTDGGSVDYSGGVSDVVSYLMDPAKLPRPAIVVDCTSSQPFADAYPTILKNQSIHLVTPNKKAFSGAEELYSAIDSLERLSPNFVFKEATVGAGLPVISTLRELVITGDKIKKIEGVFSGTMSYIFNQFSKAQLSSVNFSEVVAIAKSKGYTEPNPADDLSGSDVARKLCILARNVTPWETNTLRLPCGFQSVPTQSLVPEQLMDVKTPEEFMTLLPQFDSQFDKLRADAYAEGCVLRYVGIIDMTATDGACLKAGLEKYPFSHPFATLTGSDNIISFHSERYSTSPLIIQGAGAGAEVTAMGVVGDMVKVAERQIGRSVA